MNKNYNHTEPEIQQVLKTFNQCIDKGNYKVETEGPRRINGIFIDNYNLRDAEIIKILKDIQVDEFCYTTISTHRYHAGNTLYVFQPIVELYNPDDILERIQMYVKFDILETKRGERSTVISFHDAQWSERYCFR